MVNRLEPYIAKSKVASIVVNQYKSAVMIAGIIDDKIMSSKLN